MLYIKRIVIADITRQIGLTQEVSDSFFRFDPSSTYERYLIFQKKSGSNYIGYIKKTGHSVTIIGDFYVHVKDNCEYGDLLLIKNSASLEKYTFVIVKKGTPLYQDCNNLLLRHGSRNNTIGETTHLLTTNSAIENLLNF